MFKCVGADNHPPPRGGANKNACFLVLMNFVGNLYVYTYKLLKFAIFAQRNQKRKRYEKCCITYGKHKRAR